MSTILAVPPRKEEVRHAPRLPGVGTGHVDEAVERVLCGRFAERSFVHVHGSSALNATASFGARAAAMAKRSASVKSDSRRTSRRGYTRCIDLSWGEDMLFVPFHVNDHTVFYAPLAARISQCRKKPAAPWVDRKSGGWGKR